MLALVTFALLLSATLSFQPHRLSLSRFVQTEKRVQQNFETKSMQLFKIKKESENDDYFESEV